MHDMWPEPAAHSWAHLGLQRCHHHHLDCPKSQQTHLPGLQHMPTMWPEPAAHFWADLGPLNCHPQHLDCPKYWPCELQGATRQMRLLLTVFFLVPLQSGRFPQSLQRTQRFGGVFQCLTLDVDERKRSPLWTPGLQVLQVPDFGGWNCQRFSFSTG